MKNLMGFLALLFISCAVFSGCTTAAPNPATDSSSSGLSQAGSDSSGESSPQSDPAQASPGSSDANEASAPDSKKEPIPVEYRDGFGLVAGFWDSMTTEDFVTAYSLCGAELQRYFVSAEGMAYWWDSVEEALGTFASYGNIAKSQPEEGTDVFFFPSTFAKKRILLRVIVQNKKVVGFTTLENLEQAERYIEALKSEDYQAVFDQSSMKLKENYPTPEHVRALWKDIAGDAGSMTSYHSPTVIYLDYEKQQYIYSFYCTYTNGVFDIQILIAPEGIDGAFVYPSTSGVLPFSN